MSYVKATLGYRMRAEVSKKASPKDVSLRLFAHADFAGDLENAKSTSGVFLCLSGPGVFAPLAAVSKKQTCVSHSTPEAELVALNLALRAQGLPALDLAQRLFNWDIDLYVEEDNNTAIAVVNAGFEIPCPILTELTA